MVFNLDRIAADEEVAKVIDAGDHRAGLAFERRLAPTHDASVGLQLDEDIRTVRRLVIGDAEHFDVGNPNLGENPVKVAGLPDCWTRGCCRPRAALRSVGSWLA